MKKKWLECKIKTKIILLSLIICITCYEEGSKVPPPLYVPPVIHGSEVPPLSLSILHMIPLKSPNGKMEKEYI